MTALIIFLVAFAPGAFWLWLIYRRDKYMPEPKRLIIRTFFLGMAVAIPVALIESFLYPGGLEQLNSLASAIYLAFGVAGVTEEVGKFLTIRLSMFKSRYFEEPVDGLLYSAAAALGFASLENVIYVLGFGLEVILIRALFSNLAHVLFSAFWGYPLALYKTGRIKSGFIVWAGLLAAIVVHGIFDFLIFTESAFSWLVFPFFVVMCLLFVLTMRHANRISPYKPIQK